MVNYSDKGVLVLVAVADASEYQVPFDCGIERIIKRG